MHMCLYVNMHIHEYTHAYTYIHISYTLILLWKISNLEHFFSCRCCYAVSNEGELDLINDEKKEIYL